jgi:hypothetical protein
MRRRRSLYTEEEAVTRAIWCVRARFIATGPASARGGAAASVRQW